MAKVFISYARDGSHGENLAVQVQKQLQAAGFEVFRDVIGLKPGDVWYSKLEFELETSDVMVLVVSEKVRASKWVYNEVSMAEEIGIPVIPLLAEKVRQPLWLRHLQVLDFCELVSWPVLVDAVEVQVSSKDIHSNTSTSVSIVGASPIREERVISWASHSGEDQYGEYADLTIKNITQRFRLIKAGSFLMGSPESEVGRISAWETQHQVTLTKDYWLADTACTQAFWQAMMGNNPAHFKEDVNCPVEQVSWNDVQTFIQKLNQQYTNLHAYLPSEAEWEYACRAGTETAYSFGDQMHSRQVNFAGNTGRTVPGKSLPANRWGLYEMHGNVWEWCQGAWQEKFPATPVNDPLTEPGGDQVVLRVMRGGAWDYGDWSCRSANRDWFVPDTRYNDLGLRLSLGH